MQLRLLRVVETTKCFWPSWQPLTLIWPLSLAFGTTFWKYLQLGLWLKQFCVELISKLGGLSHLKWSILDDFSLAGEFFSQTWSLQSDLSLSFGFGYTVVAFDHELNRKTAGNQTNSFVSNFPPSWIFWSTFWHCFLWGSCLCPGLWFNFWVEFGETKRPEPRPALSEVTNNSSYWKIFAILHVTFQPFGRTENQYSTALGCHTELPWDEPELSNSMKCCFEKNCLHLHCFSKVYTQAMILALKRLFSRGLGNPCLCSHTH